ncbi:MAG: hypothetical protein M3405_02470 [Acidobacteriota bacterium]|jgi:hypothetical protein|nr:hypothetical protein [Acidobacteriota bacterium]
MSRQIINPETPYTFSDFFKLRVRTDEVLNYFGYTKENVMMQLEKSERELPMFEYLNAQIEDHLIHISLENEITRREFLIAPIMSFVRNLTKAKLNSEYWFEINHQLKGSLDYYLKRDNELLVVEAKNGDLSRAITQLAVEMIAVDKAEETTNNLIFGAVSTGQEWQFAKLDRKNEHFEQDVRIYTLPTNLEEIIRILIGILENK